MASLERVRPARQCSQTSLMENARCASGETVWQWISVAFAAYWAFFIAGAYTGNQGLNDVGAVFILAALGWAAMERLWVKVDSIAVICLIAAVMPLLIVLVTSADRYPGAIVKHISLYVVMALARLLRLTPASSSRMRWVLAAQVLLVLILSVTTDKGGVWDGGTRHSGLFANPNNLALIPFLLLFLVDRLRDPIAIQLIAHLIVIGVLAWTGTSGAVMAYAIGLAVHFQGLIPRAWRMPAYMLASCTVVAAIGLIALGGESILPETRLTNQIVVMRSELGNVVGGGDVAYYEQERVLGPGAASGIWRLVHWRRTVATYLNGSAAEQLFGFGIGSSPAFMGKLPHNEYIRVLFEQGIFGLALFLTAWIGIIRTAPPDVRYVGLILAIYSFSENNLDNFPFMALFILCLSASGKLPSAMSLAPNPRSFNYAMAC